MPAVSPLHGEPPVDHQPGDGVPQPVGRLPGEQPRSGLFGQRLPGGLGDIPHVSDPEAGQPPSGRPAGAGVGGAAGVLPAAGLSARCPVTVVAGPAQDRGEDLNACLALADLPARRPPRLKAGDQGGVGALQADRQDVVERVGVEPAGDVELVPRLPTFAS